MITNDKQNIRKTALTLLLFATWIFCTHAQLSIDAGANISLCRNKFGVVDTTPVILAVTGNAGSYKARWDFKHSYGLNVYTYGSMILDDTASLNPRIISADALPNNQWMPLYVTVTDSAGNMATDSIEIRYSWFSCLCADLTDRTISPYDTAAIYALSGGAIPPLHYSWYPDYAIDDTTHADPYVSPDHNTTYVCTVTDSIGCVSDWGDVWNIYVDTTHTGIHDTKIGSSSNFAIYPNPSTSNEHFTILSSQSGLMLFYNLSGQMICQMTFGKGVTAISDKLYEQKAETICYQAIFDDFTSKSGIVSILK